MHVIVATISGVLDVLYIHIHNWYYILITLHTMYHVQGCSTACMLMEGRSTLIMIDPHQHLRHKL